MLILNINGPINAGKTTVSTILAQQLPNALFIEVDDLLSDTEQACLKISRQEGWAERQRRLNKKLAELKNKQTYETIIFAYPLTEKSYQDWSAFSDEKTIFLNITLAPDMDICLQNRGTRELTEWEKKRIHQMYQEGYQNRPYADFIINNSMQTPEETAHIIVEFIRHALSEKQQWLHLVERRWPALLNGEKTSTFRLNEGFVHKGFLVYKDCPNEKWRAVVYVTAVYYVPLKQALMIDGFDDHTPDIETGLQQMRAHYPHITLNTPVLFVCHLSVPETEKQFFNEVHAILKKRI